MGIVKESLDDVNNVLKEDPENYRVCAAPDLARSLLSPGVRHKLTFVYYCIQTAKDIVKFLSRYGSPIFRGFFDSECRYPIPMGRLIHGVWKISDFRQKSPFISETVYDIGPWLLWIINKNK